MKAGVLLFLVLLGYVAAYFWPHEEPRYTAATANECMTETLERYAHFGEHAQHFLDACETRRAERVWVFGP